MFGMVTALVVADPEGTPAEDATEEPVTEDTSADG